MTRLSGLAHAGEEESSPCEWWAFGFWESTGKVVRLAGNRSYKGRNTAEEQGQDLTRISRQAALRRVIWSAMVRVVKPGSCLANSTVLMMHLVESSLNLSQRSMSRETRCSELLFWGRQGGLRPRLRHPLQPGRCLPSAQPTLPDCVGDRGWVAEAALSLWHPQRLAYRSVLAQLAEGREGLLMRFAHLLDELPHLRRQRVAL